MSRFSLRVNCFIPVLFQYYESLLVEAKSKVESSISEAVDKAVTSKMQDIQNKLEKYAEEKNAVADVSC
jgi:BRCA1-associated protein